MDRDQKSTINFVLLSWVRGYKDIKENDDKQDEFKQNLEKIEEFLEKHNITNLDIINKSEDYYTLSYHKDGQPKIKQFITSEVEKHI